MSLHKYKLVFVGDQSVGKTSIMARYTRDEFSPGNQPTVGVDFVSKSIQTEGKTIRMQLWDTAGQERFRSLIPSYVRDSHVIILVYDIANRTSFENLPKWLSFIKEERGENEVLLFLVGNKQDEPSREVTAEEAEAFREEHPVVSKCVEVSAKTGHQVGELFKQVTTELLEQNNDLDQSYYIPIEKHQLGKNTAPVQKKPCC